MIDHVEFVPAQCADRPNCGRVFKVPSHAVGADPLYCPQCAENAQYL